MFDSFRKKSLPVTRQGIVTADKLTNKAVEEIHETFYTEVDRLLAEAKIEIPATTDCQWLIDKCARLKALGFTNTKEVQEAEKELARLQKVEQDNKQKAIVVRAINYFSQKYPQYKFITEDSVKKICEKYNLVYGEIERYTGAVPDRNLKHMENFKIDEHDECWSNEDWHTGLMDTRLMNRKYETFQMQEDRRAEKAKALEDHEIYLRRLLMSRSLYHTNKIHKCPLEIAAPVKDFNTEGMEVKDRKISKIHIPDPVVLKPVIFEGQKFYLIVTAWGEEAGDDLVMNPNHN